MRKHLHEFVAGLFVLAAVVGLPWALAWEGSGRASDGGPRVITLTGVKKDGAWTDEPVDGTSYWRKAFRPATIVLAEGEEVLLRLTSADVRHGFYVPELGVGPVEVDPGKVVEVRLRGLRAGDFTYYCTTVCGHCHYDMRGLVRVVPRGMKLADLPAPKPAATAAPHCGAEPSAPATGNLVERGRALFAQKSCVSCHGARGNGGVVNPNSITGTVPQNNLLAEKMGLFEREDASTAIGLLEKRADLAALAETPPFRTYGQFLAQLDAVRKVILNGNPAGTKDPTGSPPPLHMPSWRYHVSDEDVDALIAFLIAQYPWEDEE